MDVDVEFIIFAFENEESLEGMSIKEFDLNNPSNVCQYEITHEGRRKPIVVASRQEENNKKIVVF